MACEAGPATATTSLRLRLSSGGCRTVGQVEEAEMWRTFNMGIGMILCVERSQADDVIRHLNDTGETAFLYGHLENA